MFNTYYADAFITITLGWIRSISDWLWSAFSNANSDSRAFLTCFFASWRTIAIVILIIGLVMDWLIWMVRWRPYWLWFGRKRAKQDAEYRHSERNARPRKRTQPQSRKRAPAASLFETQQKKKETSAGHEINWFE